MIQIRIATAQDIALIHHLGAAAFIPTYLPFISHDQVHYMFHKIYNNIALEEQMSVQGHCFLLAYKEEQALGFASYESAATNNSAKLHKLYILPGEQSAGMGKALLLAVEEFALAKGMDALLLNVNRYNKAVDFYKHMGYQVVGEEDIDIGNGFFMNDYEMKKSLQ